MTDTGVVVHCFRAVDVMIMAQVYFQAVLFRIFPVWSSKYVMLVQDSVFIPIVMECYAEITSLKYNLQKELRRNYEVLFVYISNMDM